MKGTLEEYSLDRYVHIGLAGNNYLQWCTTYSGDVPRVSAIGQLTVSMIWTECVVPDKGALVIDPVNIDRVTPLVVKADLNPWSPTCGSDAKRNR